MPHSNIPDIPEDSVVKKKATNNKPEITQKPPDNTLVYGEINGALSGLGELKVELLKLHTTVSDMITIIYTCTCTCRSCYIVQSNLLLRTLYNKDTSIIRTGTCSCGPNAI